MKPKKEDFLNSAQVIDGYKTCSDLYHQGEDVIEANSDNFIPTIHGGLSSQCRVCHNYTRYLKAHDIEEFNRRKEEKRKLPIRFRRK